MRLLFSMTIGLGLILPAYAQVSAPAAQAENPTGPAPADKVPRGKISLTLEPGRHTAHVSQMFFTSDRKQLITVSNDQSIRIWDTANWLTHKVIYPPPGGPLWHAALSPNGDLLAVASRYHEKGKDGKWRAVPVIYLLGLPEGQIERVLRGHTSSITGLAFSPDGKRLASSGGNDRTTRIWNLAKEQPPQVFQSNWGADVGQLAFSPDGKRLVRIRAENCQIIDGATGKEVVGNFSPGACRTVAWSPDGKTIAVAGHGLGFWGPNGEKRRLLRKDTIFNDIVFSADSQTVLVAWGEQHDKGSHNAALFDVATGKQLKKFAPAGTGSSGCALSADGEWAASLGWSEGGVNDLFIWKTANAAVVKNLTGNKWIDRLPRAAWSPDGKKVCWQSWGDKIPVFDLAELRFHLPLPPSALRGAVLQQGPLTLKREQYHTFRLIKDGNPSVKLSTGDHAVDATLVGKERAALWSSYGFALLNLGDGKEIHRFQGHNGAVQSVAPSPNGGRYLISLSQDQTLKLWDPEKNRPLLSLYVRGKDWIAWTEEGYYAATPGGERLMGWKIDNGMKKPATFSPASRFRASLYRPDVIKLVIAEGSVAKALATADKARGQASKAIEVAQVLPPEVKVTITSAGAAKVTVLAEAEPQGAQPITSLQLLIDDRPYTGKDGLVTIGQPKAGLVKRSWQLNLSPGPHDIRVLARTDASLGSSRGIKRVDIQAAPAKKEPNLYVLAVGINAYPGTLKLNGAVSDAKNLSKAFRDNSAKLFGSIEVKEIIDKEATRDGILAGLDWLESKATPADVTVFFFAGHGERDKNEFYLVPQDVNVNDLAKTGISRMEIKKRMQALSGNVLVLLDACHSGAIGLLFDDLSRELIDEDCGVAVMCAARPSQFALEAKGQGFFTQSLVGGLGGKAQQRNGSVFLHHLQSYVIDEVSGLSQNRQHPVAVVPPWMRPFALSKPAKGP